MMRKFSPCEPEYNEVKTQTVQESNGGDDEGASKQLEPRESGGAEHSYLSGHPDYEEL